MRIYLIFSLFLISGICTGQPKEKWDKWDFLSGTWIGEGSGQPGQGGGTFTFSYDLDQNILIRKSHTEFPAANGRPASVHDDIMVVYPESGGFNSVYFDNESHVINYKVTFSEHSVVLTSEKKGNMPVFRLTYEPLDDNTVNVKFEMSQDGEKFMTYLEGKSSKVK